MRGLPRSTTKAVTEAALKDEKDEYLSFGKRDLTGRNGGNSRTRGEGGAERRRCGETALYWPSTIRVKRPSR